MSRFKLTEIQANAILAMQLRTLAGLERKKIEDEYEELQKLIKRLEGILSSEANILKVIREELVEMKEKYGDKRRTQIIKKAIGNFSDEDLIPDEEVIITLTKGNYIKRIPANTYASQGRGGKGKMGMTTKEEDVVEHLVHANSHNTILFFTSAGRVFKLKAYELPPASRVAKGASIMNVLNLSPDEKVTALVGLTKDDPTQYLFMATRGGTIKKTALKDFANIRTNGIVAIKLDQGDELRWVKKTTGKDEVIISTAMAQAIRFKETDVRPMGRATRGARGIPLADAAFAAEAGAGSPARALAILENRAAYTAAVKTTEAWLGAVAQGPLGKAVWQLDVLARRVEKSDDAEGEWRAELRRGMRLSRALAGNDPGAFVRAGEGLLFAWRQVGSAVSPRLPLEAAALSPYLKGEPSLTSFFHPRYL
jgi:DNA gyrase/topoisomerase IV subunit A